MNLEMGYRKVRNLLFVLWLVRNVDYVIKKTRFLQPWLEQLETSPAGEYITSVMNPLLENNAFQDVRGNIYRFLGIRAFMLLITLIVVKFLVGKIREADLILQLHKIYTCVKLTIECSAIPRIRVGKSRYIRVMNKSQNTDDIIPIEAEKEAQYDEITFFKKKGKVHLQKPNGQKMYLEHDIWKKCNVDDEELWIKLV